MSTPPPLSMPPQPQYPGPYGYQPVDKDAEHLKLLSVFHWVLGGLAILGLLFLVGHYLLMMTVFEQANTHSGSSQSMPPEAKVILGVMYLIFGVFILLAGALNVYSAICIKKRKNRTLSLAVAGLNCLSIPLGTILGIFTFIVLTRTSVIVKYEAAKWEGDR